MANTTLNELKGLVAMVPYYDGNVKILNNFLKVVNELYAELCNINLTSLQIEYLFNMIKKQIK